jgi:hypothetical protein
MVYFDGGTLGPRMQQIVRQKKSTGATGLKKSSGFVREYREEILRQKEARNCVGPRDGFEAITNYNRQTARLVRRENLYLAAAETGNPEYVRKALGKSGLNHMNNLRIYVAHKIATHGGGSRRQVTYEEAAKFLVKHLLPPKLRKEFPKKRIISIRKEIDRRFGKKARKFKKLNKLYFPDDDFAKESREIADKAIQACKGDYVALGGLALRAIAAIELLSNV